MSDYHFFNQQLKEEFIIEKTAETTVANNYLQILFNSSSEFENKLGKDICNFTIDEILTYYKACNRKSPESLAVMNSMLNQYTIWCLKKNLVADSQNHFSNITKDLYSTCVNKMYKKLTYVSKETVYSWLDKIVNYCDRYVILALYEGISGDNFTELVNLKYSDIIDGKAHLCTGRVIPISKQLDIIAETASKETIYYTLSDNSKEMKLVETDDTILKSYPNIKLDVSDFQKGRRVYNKLKRLMGELDFPYFKTKNIIDSGKINFINERCKELGITGHEFLYSDHIKEIDKQYGGSCVRSNFERIYGEYLIK